MITRAFFKVCLVLIFFNTIVEKKHTLNLEITILYQFHDQKALFKVPKICSIIFWIENDPNPLTLLRFGSLTLPLVTQLTLPNKLRNLNHDIEC